MSVKKRRTTKGLSKEYHYAFMQGGKRYHGVCEGCSTEKDALLYEKNIKKAAKKLSEQKSVNALVENFKQELTGGEIITIDQAFDKYLAKPRRRMASEKQQRINRSQWNDFRAFVLDLYPDIKSIDKITRSMAEEYINHLQRNGRYASDIKYTRKQGDKNKTYTYKANTKLSFRTVNAFHKTLKSVFSKLKEDAGLLYNPFDFEMIDGQPEIRDAFSVEELRLIGNNLDSFTKPIFLIGICTGLSMGDICLLRWNTIRDGWIITKRKKTGVELEIPILPPLAKFLLEQKELTGDEKYILPEHAKLYHTNPSGVSYRVRKFLERLGIVTSVKLDGRKRRANKKGCHSIRHTFAYMAGLHQIPLSTVQSVLGHSSTSMTLHYQRHADRQAKERHLLQMPNFLVNESPKSEEKERGKLKQLADTLPIDKVKELLKYVDATG